MLKPPQFAQPLLALTEGAKLCVRQQANADEAPAAIIKKYLRCPRRRERIEIVLF
jgi:hypothetical protein